MSAQYRQYKMNDNDENPEGNVQLLNVNGGSAKKSSDSVFRAFTIMGIVSAILLLITCLYYQVSNTNCDIFSDKPSFYTDASNDHSVSSLSQTRSLLNSMINSSSIMNYAKEFSSKSHMAGSEADAEYMRKIQAHFRSAGLTNVHVKEYKALISQPDPSRPNHVSIVDQDGNEVVSTSGQRHTGFCLYSPAGNVTAPPLFVNYGRPQDYLQIQQYFNHTESVFKGKILIAKQYHISAAEQYKYAYMIGAAGLLLYPDPEQYNPEFESPFPDSHWLPEDAVRSESIFLNGVGDPQTFDISSLPYAFRANSSVKFYLPIPAQPISYGFAREIFKQMLGLSVPFEMEGKLNISHFGPGMINNRHLHLQVNNVNVPKIVSNVFGMIPGDSEPDRYIIIGHQRDSYSNGAFGTASGTAVFLELVKVFTDLMNKRGWRPRRSIVFASFGAEEFNLIGSTEWIQHMEKILSARSVCYINANKLVSGNDTLKVIASPLLYSIIYNATSGSELPSGEESVFQLWLSNEGTLQSKNLSVLSLNPVKDLLEEKYHFNEDSFPEHVMDYADPEVHQSYVRKYLNSASAAQRPKIMTPDLHGSYGPFVTIAGIPVIDIQLIKNSYPHQEFSEIPFRQYNFYPLENTQYDTFDVYEKFTDPDFRNHRIVTKILAEIVLELSSSRFLPINLLDYAQQLNEFHFRSVHMHNTFFKDHVKVPSQTVIFDSLMDSLQSAIVNFTISAINFHQQQDKVDSRNILAHRRMNDQLMFVERFFLDHRGIPNNSLKKHLILSPSDSLVTLEFFEISFEGLFPALIDEMADLYVYQKNFTDISNTLQKHIPILINAVQTAAHSLDYTYV